MTCPPASGATPPSHRSTSIARHAQVPLDAQAAQQIAKNMSDHLDDLVRKQFDADVARALQSQPYYRQISVGQPPPTQSISAKDIRDAVQKIGSQTYQASGVAYTQQQVEGLLVAQQRDTLQASVTKIREGLLPNEDGDLDKIAYNDGIRAAADVLMEILGASRP